VANHPNPFLGRRLRLEHWQNAQNQGMAAARSMLGARDGFSRPTSSSTVATRRHRPLAPFFWTGGRSAGSSGSTGHATYAPSGGCSRPGRALTLLSSPTRAWICARLAHRAGPRPGDGRIAHSPLVQRAVC
jgi:hypothetical protein